MKINIISIKLVSVLFNLTYFGHLESRIPIVRVSSEQGSEEAGAFFYSIAQRELSSQCP